MIAPTISAPKLLFIDKSHHNSFTNPFFGIDDAATAERIETCYLRPLGRR